MTEVIRSRASWLNRRWGKMAIAIGGIMRKIGTGDAKIRQALQVRLWLAHQIRLETAPSCLPPRSKL